MSKIDPELEAWKLHTAVYPSARRKPNWDLANSLRDAREREAWTHFGHN
jgi:hypothetical protein